MLPVDDCPCVAPLIMDDVLLVEPPDDRVQARDGRVVQNNMTLGVAPDQSDSLGLAQDRSSSIEQRQGHRSL